MRYKTDKFFIPWYRLRHWPIGRWHEWKRPLLLVLIGLSVGTVISIGESWLEEKNNRLSSENAHQSLIADVHRLYTYGAPGYVLTDWQEKTTNLKVKMR